MPNSSAIRIAREQEKARTNAELVFCPCCSTAKPCADFRGKRDVNGFVKLCIGCRESRNARTFQNEALRRAFIGWYRTAAAEMPKAAQLR